MSSQRRVASSRANGAKSHGPITPEGKKRSSQNAIALDQEAFAQCIIAYGEPPAGLAELRQAYFDRFEPNDAAEWCLVDQMVAADWRISRVTTMETQALNKYLDRHHDGTNPYAYAEAFAAVAAEPATALLQRYESRLQLAHQRALRGLKLLRTIAPPTQEEAANNEPSPITEEREPVQSDPPSTPQPLGKVGFSSPTSSPSAACSPAHLPSEPHAAQPSTPPEAPNEPGDAGQSTGDHQRTP
jgi:hypothetical protein